MSNKVHKMWFLLKAETHYNLNISLGIGLNLLFLFFGMYLKKRIPISLPFSLMLISMLIVSVLFHFYVKIASYKEKRERKHSLLPVEPGKLWLARLIHIILFWLSLIILAVLMAYVLPFFTINSIQLIPALSITGVVATLHGLLYCLGDLPFTATPTSKFLGMPLPILLIVVKYISYLILTVLVALLFAGNIIAMTGNFQWLLPTISFWLVNNAAGALSIWLLAVITGFISSKVYQNRRSFV